MTPWQDETISIRRRICLWLATHENEFTTEDTRKALKVRKNTNSNRDKVSQEISVLVREEKLTRGYHRGILRLYKKAEGMDFSDIFPRISNSELTAKALDKAPKQELKMGPGIKGVIVHYL